MPDNAPGHNAVRVASVGLAVAALVGAGWPPAGAATSSTTSHSTGQTLSAQGNRVHAPGTAQTLIWPAGDVLDSTAPQASPAGHSATTTAFTLAAGSGRSTPGWAPRIEAAQWYLDTTGARSAWSVTDGTGVTVAVMDVGVDSNHPDLASNSGGNGVTAYAASTTTVPARVMLDTDGHGTHVAGIAAAGNDGVGMTGVAPGATIMPLKFTNGSYSEEVFYDAQRLEEGLRAADAAGADVVNMSFGEGQADEGSIATHPICQAIARVAELDLVIVAAAGNDAAHGNEPHVPASCPGVISVGALAGDLTPAPFSTHNDHVDIAAPGVEIMSTLPGVYGGYGQMSGTSMASPIVAGAAALVRAAHPDWDAAQVAAQLTATARDIGAPGRDPYTGAGLLDVAAAVGLPATPEGGPSGLDLDLAGTTLRWRAPRGGASSYTLEKYSAAEPGTPERRIDVPAGQTTLELDAPLRDGEHVELVAVGTDGTVSRAIAAAGRLVAGAPATDLDVTVTPDGHVKAQWRNPEGTVRVQVTVVAGGQVISSTLHSAELGQPLPRSVNVPLRARAAQEVTVSVSAMAPDSTAGDALVTLQAPARSRAGKRTAAAVGR